MQATMLAALVGVLFVAADGGFPKNRAPAKPIPANPMELVEAARRDLKSQEQRAGELLAWLEHLRRNPSAVTDEDRVVVFHVLMLFAELRYAPAIPYLIAEEIEPKVGWRDPQQKGRLSDVVGSLRPYITMDPSFAAFVKIGGPSVTALVTEYVRHWTTADKDKRERLLGRFESILGRRELLGETLVEVQDRLVRASRTPGDRDETDAYLHLKWKLLKKFD